MGGKKIGGNFGTGCTFFKVMDLSTWTFLWPTMVARQLVAMAISYYYNMSYIL